MVDIVSIVKKTGILNTVRDSILNFFYFFKYNTTLTIIILIAIIILLLGFLYNYIRNKQQKEPVLVREPLDSTKYFEVDAISLPKSMGGYSYSFWINIEDYTYRLREIKNILKRIGGGPTIYLEPLLNNLCIQFDNKVFKYENIPINEWVHIVLTITDFHGEIYINSKLAHSFILPENTKLGYGNIILFSEGGFKGKLNQLEVFGVTLEPKQIRRIYNRGATPFNLPALNTISVVDSSTSKYISDQYTSMKTNVSGVVSSSEAKIQGMFSSDNTNNTNTTNSSTN